MKNLLIGFLSVMLTLSVTANEKETKSVTKGETAAAVAVTGTIFDSKSGELLAGVEVKIEGTDSKTYTDFDGNFTFNPIVPGKYKLVTNYISYKQNALIIEAGLTTNPVEIKLENP